MNFIEYTEKILHEASNKKKLVIAPEYHPINCLSICGEDIVTWCENYRKTAIHETSYLFDLVLCSRVLEHIPIRQIDWYLLELYNIMKEGATFVCVVPDMCRAVELMEQELARDNGPRDFVFNRINYELFSEGDDIRDRHATWTSKASMKHLLERENLFRIDSIESVYIGDLRFPQLEVRASRI